MQGNKQKLFVVNRAIAAVSMMTVLTMGLFANAEWVSLSNANNVEYTVSNQTKQGFDVNVKFSGFEYNMIQNSNGEQLVQITMPTLENLNLTGQPDLPKSNKSLLIPSQSNPSFNIVDVQTVDMNLGKIAPSKGPVTRDVNIDQVALTFGSFYKGTKAYPSQLVEMGQKFVMRDSEGVNLQVNPIVAKANGQITAVKEITIHVNFNNASFARSAKTNFLSTNKVEPSFEQLYATTYLNYNSALSNRVKPEHLIKDQSRLLVITHKSFTAGLTEWTQWKTDMGWDVKVAEVGKDVESTAAKIKAFVADDYAKRGTSYLVLVGDAEFVPYALGLTGNVKDAEADPMYGMILGNDKYPEVFVSRLSVKTAAELAIVLKKGLDYERSPDVKGDWYSKGSGIASDEGSPTDGERAEELRVMMLNKDYKLVDKFYDPGVTASQVANALNEGRGYINYIGHGSKTSWGTSYFNNTNIDQLKNDGGKLPFIVSVACVNGQFGSGSDSFAERWIKAGTLEKPTGAFAIFASSTNQAWVEPTVGQKEITTLLTTDKMNTIGSLFTHGNVAILESNMSSAVQTVESWHIFGDATVQVRTRLPEAITVASQTETRESESERVVELKVNEPNIKVGVVRAGALVGTALSDAQGVAKVQLATGIQSGEKLKMTLTGFNKIPLIQDYIAQ